jgi:redox-sensitive bicupin YhaK (pirin superfamily)
MDPDSALDYTLPENWNAILFIYKGEAYVGEEGQFCQEKSTVHLKKDENTMLHVTSKLGCDFVLIAGQPLGEPVEQYGPFVMTTRAELQKAFEDYQSASNGFEGADSWKSEIRKMSKKEK